MKYFEIKNSQLNQVSKYLTIQLFRLDYISLKSRYYNEGV